MLFSRRTRTDSPRGLPWFGSTEFVFRDFERIMKSSPGIEWRVPEHLLPPETLVLKQKGMKKVPKVRTKVGTRTAGQVVSSFFFSPFAFLPTTFSMPLGPPGFSLTCRRSSFPAVDRTSSCRPNALGIGGSSARWPECGFVVFEGCILMVVVGNSQHPPQ